MGARELISAVADAGPLIHLHEAGLLHLLGIFACVHVPEAVWQESTARGRVPEQALVGLGIVQRHDVAEHQVGQFAEAHPLHHLHVGERHSLFLCHSLGVRVLLTDDLDVRKAAKSLGLTPVGSFGVVVRAFRLGRLPLRDAERGIQRIQETSTLFVTPAVIELALEELRRTAADIPPNGST